MKEIEMSKGGLTLGLGCDTDKDGEVEFEFEIDNTFGYIDKQGAEQIIKHLQEVFDTGLSDGTIKEIVIENIEDAADYNSKRDYKNWSPERVLNNRDLTKATLKAVDYLGLTTDDF